MTAITCARASSSREYELKGVPVRLWRWGPRDMENGTIELVRRYTLEKETVPQEGLVERIRRADVRNPAKYFQQGAGLSRVDDYQGRHVGGVQGGARQKGRFVLAHWDGTVETEVAIKDATKATIRCIPFDAPDEEGTCVFSGKPSHRRVLFARSY